MELCLPSMLTQALLEFIRRHVLCNWENTLFVNKYNGVGVHDWADNCQCSNVACATSMSRCVHRMLKILLHFSRLTKEIYQTTPDLRLSMISTRLINCLDTMKPLLRSARIDDS